MLAYKSRVSEFQSLIGFKINWNKCPVLDFRPETCFNP